MKKRMSHIRITLGVQSTPKAEVKNEKAKAKVEVKKEVKKTVKKGAVKK